MAERILPDTLSEGSVSFSSDVVDAILSGKVSDRDSLQRLKSKLCEKYGLDRMPSNPEILAEVPADLREKVEPTLRLKPIRSLSGVAIVAVMASPAPCPHGKCMYCPGGPESGTAQSYTGQEPAARRAARNEFDPFRQVRSRLDQLSQIGHPIDKIDLIIMGGTFPARERQYQENFILRIYDALNGSDSQSVEEAQEKNELAPSRCIGMTFETRPDQFTPGQISYLMSRGMTRIELGVQTVYEDIMKNLERGHTVADSIDATTRAKHSGLKVCYHLMPGLPGSTMKSDIEMFRSVFNNPMFRPDMLKIYPTLVIKGTKLYDAWKRGEYEPPDTDYIVDIMVEVKRSIPEWVRIQRIQRDIPIPLIDAGARKSNARQMIAAKLAEKGEKCNCIRCREIGHVEFESLPEEAEMSEKEYAASHGTEHFIQVLDPCTEALIGFARLRVDIGDGRPIARLRELRIFGQQVPIDDLLPEGLQHRGYGRQLLDRCEELSWEKGAEELLVTSGVGARGYYRKSGYLLDGCYMVKKRNSR